MESYNYLGEKKKQKSAYGGSYGSDGYGGGYGGGYESGYGAGYGAGFKYGQKTSESQGDGFQFVDVLKQLAGGFIQGFTTLDVVEEEADHWLESLAQGAGTMMGFIGMIPTGGKSAVIGKGVGLGIRGIKAGVSLLGKEAAKEGAERIVAQGIKGIRHVTQPVVGKYFTQTRSVPMYAADVIMGMGKKALAGTPAEALAKRLIGKNVIIGDVAEGAVKMGLASSVSSWQGGIDQMMYSFGTGAAFGGADRGVSNMLAQLGVNSQVVRALAGMAVNGIPSTIMDQPLEIQVFDYLTGAWFGTEMPYAQRKAYEAFTGPNAIMSDGKKRLDAYLNPESLPEYVNADELYGNQAEKVRLELKHQARMWLGTAVGNAKAGYPSQMVSHAIFKERYDALFEKYKNEGKTDDNAEELALDEIRKDPTTKHLIETSEELNERIANEEFGTPDMLNYSAAMDFAQSRIKEKATERSPSDKTIDATIGTRAPEEAASINKDIEDITTRGEEELIETVNQSEQQGISLDRLIGLEKQRPQDVPETITDNDWIPFINDVGISERIIDQVATKELLGQQLSVRESQVKERFADRIITRTNEIQASGDLDNPIKDLNKPIDLSYSTVEPRPVADDTFVPGKDDLGSQADIIAKEPIQEARDSIGGDDFSSTAIDLNSHKVNLQDARQDIDPIISQYRTAADYVGRQLTMNDGLITKDNYTAHHDNLMEQFRLATNDYLTTNSKGFKTDYDLARWFVDSYKGNSKLKDSDQVLLSQQLVQSLHKLRSNKTLNQYVVDVYGKTVKRVDSNTNSGKLISVSKAPAFHTRALQKLGKNTYSIKYATKPFAEKGAEEGAYMTKGIIDDVKDPDDLLWMHHQMAKDNKIFMGHVKSNAEFVYYDGFDVDPARLVDADNNPIGLDKYIENTIFDAGGKAALDTYTRGKQNYVDKISKQVQGESKADIERAYDQYVYNQIELFTNVLNKGVPLKDMVKKGFINDALALNKRMQLINADGYTARDRSFEGVEGVKSEAGDYGFNYVILSSANRTQIDGKTITKKAGVDDDYFYVQNKDGGIDRVTSETSTDGAVTVRQDVFDAMVKDAGYDPESGVAKSVMVGDNESGLGMLASKHSMQRAGDAQDKWMKENNVHMILRDTATKQYGKRKIYDSQLKDDGTMDLYDRNTGEAISLSDKANIYRMPVDTVEYNLTTKEDISHSLSEQVLPRQLMQNMNPAIINPEIIRGVYEETYLKSMIGDESVNKQLEESKLTGPLTKEQASKLNIDKVSLENLNDIIAGRYGEEAYDVAIRHILTKRTMEDPEDYVDSADFMGEDMSGADRIILARSESGEKLSPFLLAHKNLNKYVETKIVSYYNQRITRPEMEYSLKAIGLQTDEFNRGKVNAGEFMLGKGSRNMKVKSKALGEDTTLGKLWDAYESTKAKNIDGSYNQKIKDFEDDLRMVVIRVPADSISGTRSLMFKGFYDNRGTGVALHSEDMAALGGMDLDIDSTFIYQNLGKGKYGKDKQSLHDILLANKDQWVKKVGDVEKKWSRFSENNYEVSSAGDSRFSALKAKLKDGRTIEEAWQLDVKGYRSKGDDPMLGKGKKPLIKMTKEESWQAYKGLWKQWADENPDLIKELMQKSEGKVLTDKFATSENNQARALAEIINETQPQQRRNVIIDSKNDAGKEIDLIKASKESALVDLKQFINHSGGAIGSDTQWDVIGSDFGMTQNKHYWAETKTPKGNTEISKTDFEEGRIESAKAAKRNFGYQYSTMKDSRLIRNWAQVKYSDSIFAIGEIVKKGEKIFPEKINDTRIAQIPSVAGGTGYAVGMAINNNKPVYIFNQNKNSYEIGWYKWDSDVNDFVKVDTPILTKNFAGIGTRGINERGKQAIKDVYIKTSQQKKQQLANKDQWVKEVGDVEKTRVISESKNDAGKEFMEVQDIDKADKNIGSMFDPAYLTRAGVNATNGKSAVGYAASAKKYIESWFAASPKETIYSADHLKNFERLDANGNLVNKKRKVLDSILKANNIDPTKNTVELVSIKKEEALTGDNGLLAMARQAMNYAADSADLYSVISPLKISSKLWDVVFETKIKVTDAKGNVKYLDPEVTVNNKKVSLGNLRPPQYESHKRALQSTESYKRDEYGTRKTKSLYEFMYALDGKVADGANDVASMLARDLSSMKLNDPNLFDLMGMPGLEYSYGPMIDAYKRTYTAEGVRKEIGVARKGAGTQAAKNRLEILESLFLYKSRNSANAVNAIRRDIATKYNEMANTKDPDSIYKIKTEISLMVDKAKQLVSQDISDIASSAMLFSRAEKIMKGKNPEQKKKIVAAMTEIARKADEFKRTYSTIAKQAAQNQGVNKAPALDLFQTQIKDFRDSLPSAGQKDLFDMYMLGSLNFQDPAKVAREQKLYELVTSDKSRTDPNYEANLKEYQQASDELYRNNANALGSFVKAINIKNVSEYYKGYETTARYLSNVELTRNGQISKLKMQGLVSAINKSSLDRPDSVVTKVDDVVVGKKDAVESTQVTKQTVAKLADPIENVKEFDDATSVIESKGVDLSKYIDIAKTDDGKIAIDPDNLKQDVALAEMVAAKTGKNVTDTTREFIKKTLGKDDDTIQDVNDKAYLQQLADIFDPKQTFNKEELLLIKDFKDLMGYHDAHHAPGWFASHFLSYWHGTMQKNFGSTIDPKNATLYDVRNFMQTHRFGRDYIWDVMKQGKTSKFHWKNFFWFPDTIAKHTETFDYKLQTIISYQQDFEGNLTKVYGIAPTSTMSGLHTIASSVNDMTSAMHNYRDEVVLKDFKIMENLGDDAYTLFDHAVIAHELKNKVGDREVYLAEYNKSKAKYDAIKGKDYIVTIDEDGVTVNKKMNSDEVIEHIQKQLSSHLKSFYDTYVKGNMPDGTIVKMDDPDVIPRTMEFIDIDKTIERVWALTKQRQDADTQIIGMNTLGKIMYQRRLENIAEGLIANGDKRSKIDIMDSLNMTAEKRGVGYKDIGEISEGYFPHLNHPDKIVEEYTLKALEAEANANNITDQIERAKYIARSEQTISRSHQNYIDKQLWDSEIANIKTEADFDAFVTNIGLDSKNRNTRSRGEKTTLPGWQRDIRTMKQYEKDIVKAYYNNMLAVLGDVRIKDFNNNVKNIDPADKAKWSKFMELYLRDNLGYPSVFSEADLAALPEIKKSPYWKFTDEYVSGKLSSMSSKFGKVPGKTKQEQIYNTTQWIQNFSNLEAKYQLMTLLSRPKTFINNIVGGEPNTIINAGFRHWKGSFSLSHLRNRIDPSFNSMADVQRWAESHGATESYLANDISRINKMAPAEVKEAINRMADVIKGKPDVKDMELLEIWKKSGLSESVFDKFAFFMRASERQLRTRSFVTHYLKARETFEASGSMIDANDPLLISMAIKGVNATQFVYNNANRPAFSRTALGKVVSRFQLWAWNSTRFRTQIYNDLKQYGMQPNSEAGKRFERMMILDMMMLGLASLLPFSVFESTLPQPMGWLVNTSKWLFGDEEDREKAFMGDLPTAVAPLQMVLPPSSRLITPIIGSLFSGDWERLGSYYSWTYFPYGLLARDVTRSLERPMMSPSLMFGLPLLEMDRIATKMSKQEEIGWGPLYKRVDVEE